MSNVEVTVRSPSNQHQQSTSSRSVSCLIAIIYLLALFIIIIPISSLLTILYVLLEPLQSCQVASNCMRFLFRNFVQLPLRCANRIRNNLSNNSCHNHSNEATQPSNDHNSGPLFVVTSPEDPLDHKTPNISTNTNGH